MEVPVKFSSVARVSVVAAITALALTSCAANEGSPSASGSASDSPAASNLSGELVGVGASSQGTAQTTWGAGFQTANEKVTVNYDPSGSGAGRKAFIAGGAAFAGSDSALSDEELAGSFGTCKADTKAIDIPVYISPIAVIFNVDGVKDLNLDAATLAGIFSGKITQWNDPAIVALNKDAKLPDAKINAVHRSDASGTTKNFADYLNQNAPDVWTEKPADDFPYTGGEGAQGTSGVVDAVTNGTNMIGYADASRAGKLGVVKVKVGDKFVGYSAEAAAAVVAESPLVEGRGANDLAIKLDRKTTDATHYPIVLVSYAIACETYKDPAQGTLTKAYLEYITSEAGQKAAAEKAGNAPLSADLSKKVATAVGSIK